MDPVAQTTGQRHSDAVGRAMGDVPRSHLEDLGAALIVARWTISYRFEENPLRWFWVNVYDTAEAMRESGSRYDSTGEKSLAGASAHGLVQESVMLYAEDDVDFTGDITYPPGPSGVIRLCVDFLRMEIISHELLHAAAIVYRREFSRRVDLGDGFIDLNNEERLCYIYGELSTQMFSGLAERSLV